MAHLDVEIAHQLLGGRLSPSDRASAESHLEACEGCRNLLESERSLLSMLELDEREEADENALSRLLDRVEEAEPGGAARRRYRNRLKLMARTAGVLAVACGIYSFWPQPDRNRETAQQLGISLRHQMSIVSRLDALAALREDRWLLQNYETVVSLDSLIREGRE